jgi:hypothetical protein
VTAGNGEGFSGVSSISAKVQLYGRDILTESTSGLGIATLLIFIRSIFRTAELNGGFSSNLANDEIAFMILEGASMVVACGSMSIFHPGLSLKGHWNDPMSWPLKAQQDDGVPLAEAGQGNRH